MPGLLRKLVIVAAADGLILHAHAGSRYSNGSNNEASSVRIDYKTKKITALPAATSQSIEASNALEAWGLVGTSRWCPAAEVRGQPTIPPATAQLHSDMLHSQASCPLPRTPS